MAFDGIVIAAVVKDIKEKLVGGRIVKIQQPEKDELLITVKNYDQYRLLISADAGLPLLYITSGKKEAPLTAPNFCMLLRKHIGTARIIDVRQPDFERAVVIELEHLDEMGDVCRKQLIIEIMGKHSNIIFCDGNKIIDSIKHVSAAVSSVREVLPGREYFIPKLSEKFDPLKVDEKSFTEKIMSYPAPLSKALYGILNGFSPVMANELLFRAGFSPEMNASELTPDLSLHLFKNLKNMTLDIETGDFCPCIVYEKNEDGNRPPVSDDYGIPVEFAALRLTVYENRPGYSLKEYSDISTVLESFYSAKNAAVRIKQKSSDIRKLVGNAVERTARKLDIQRKQLSDTEKRDKYKLYGDLLSTYGYGLEQGKRSAELENFYDGTTVTVPLDPELSPIENAKKYYERFSKLKRTYEAVSVQLAQSEEELLHLESINVALTMASCDDDLDIIKKELADCGYIKTHYRAKSKKNAGSREKSKPLHYVTEDGFHIYVGKNNYQNDELTFKMASGGDWWFHAKKNAGSHVIVKTEGRELPDRVYEQAAALAAFYSKSVAGTKTDVDYLQRKDVKKPNGAKPGFVVYYSNYSMTVVPEITGLTLVE